MGLTYRRQVLLNQTLSGIRQDQAFQKAPVEQQANYLDHVLSKLDPHYAQGDQQTRKGYLQQAILPNISDTYKQKISGLKSIAPVESAAAGFLQGSPGGGLAVKALTGMTPQEMLNVTQQTTGESHPFIQGAGQLAGGFGSFMAGQGLVGASRAAVALPMISNTAQVFSGEKTLPQAVVETPIDVGANLLGLRAFGGSMGGRLKSAGFQGLVQGGAGVAGSVANDVVSGQPIDATRALQTGLQSGLIGAGMGAAFPGELPQRRLEGPVVPMEAQPMHTGETIGMQDQGPYFQARQGITQELQRINGIDRLTPQETANTKLSALKKLYGQLNDLSQNPDLTQGHHQAIQEGQTLIRQMAEPLLTEKGVKTGITPEQQRAQSGQQIMDAIRGVVDSETAPKQSSVIEYQTPGGPKGDDYTQMAQQAKQTPGTLAKPGEAPKPQTARQQLLDMIQGVVDETTTPKPSTDTVLRTPGPDPYQRLLMNAKEDKTVQALQAKENPAPPPQQPASPTQQLVQMLRLKQAVREMTQPMLSKPEKQGIVEQFKTNPKYEPAPSGKPGEAGPPQVKPPAAGSAGKPAAKPAPPAEAPQQQSTPPTPGTRRYEGLKPGQSVAEGARTAPEIRADKTIKLSEKGKKVLKALELAHDADRKIKLDDYIKGPKSRPSGHIEADNGERTIVGFKVSKKGDVSVLTHTDGGQVRSYNLDSINKFQITDKPAVPGPYAKAGSYKVVEHAETPAETRSIADAVNRYKSKDPQKPGSHHEIMDTAKEADDAEVEKVYSEADEATRGGIHEDTTGEKC